ncbi:MAG: adenosylcobinamide-phosphate synthase CbiB [Zoogloeaceae bacterium]|jgi:adenosylcobinamide-phosphate synthase|nr:adenosylcobinamide-phosphate synthase CbiB [Zoogloeaceae bacterium]
MDFLTDLLTRHPALHLPLAAWAAVAVDRLLGEARRFHPLVGFGRLANGIEAALNPPPKYDETSVFYPRTVCVYGGLCWGLAVLPWVALAFWWRAQPGWAWYVDVILCYFSLGAHSLFQHGEAVRRPLAANNLPEARRRVGHLVSRDVSRLCATGVARAGVESVLENGNDAIFATLFWFALLGGPGALLLRLANTLDAMWGYRNDRFLYFGRMAARLDDAMNWIPARLTALTYALLGNPARAIDCWKRQSSAWESPNAGTVMAAGAGSLGVLLGGNAIYEDKEEPRPRLGHGADPDHRHLRAAICLVRRGLWLWVCLFLIAGVGFCHA